jgi:hypothetical protein
MGWAKDARKLDTTKIGDGLGGADAWDDILGDVRTRAAGHPTSDADGSGHPVESVSDAAGIIRQ